MLVNKIPTKKEEIVPLILINDLKNKWGGKIPFDIRQGFYFDIETVADKANLNQLPNWNRERWIESAIKWVSFRKNEEEEAIKWRDIANAGGGGSFSELDYPKSNEFWLERAGLFPEFGKIVCISFSFWNFSKNKWFDGSVAIDGEIYKDEKDILVEFFKWYSRFEESAGKNNLNVYTVGHNSVKFDIPYVFRRSVINNIAVPQNFFSPTDKSWDLKAIDTIEIWRANSTNGDSTLGTVMCVNNFENPKEDITGKDLTGYYYSENFDIQRVINYCERDVKAVKDLVVKLQTGLTKYS